MNDVRTVSDTKRAFYSLHTRPINSIYRRVVEELMVEMHLLSVNVDFRYDPIYALGVVTTFDRFMQGYRPEQDKDSIFIALCKSINGDPDKYRQNAEQVRSEVSHQSIDGLLSHLQTLPSEPGDSLWNTLGAIANNPSFRYNRLFAIGLYTLLEQIDPDLVKDEKRRNDALEKVSESLKISTDKIQKDLELYRSNLDKMAQAQAVMEDILKADRKKKEEREKAKEAAASPPPASSPEAS